MGTPPSYRPEMPDYSDFLRGEFLAGRDVQPTKHQEQVALETNPAALLKRIVEIEQRQAAIISALHHMVDQTNPACPIGVALTMAGLA